MYILGERCEPIKFTMQSLIMPTQLGLGSSMYYEALVQNPQHIAIATATCYKLVTVTLNLE